MSLVEQVTRTIPEAMKAHDHVRLATVRMLKAALMNREVERGRPLTDVEDLQVVAMLVKQRKDSIDQFARGGRQDLVDQEKAELAILEAYLPPVIDAGELERVVTAAITETGATSPKDMGRVMKAVMAALAGAQVDGRAVSDLVRRKLGG
jgi:uncharacterized protein YqeY